jgi:hypothetical protein
VITTRNAEVFLLASFTKNIHNEANGIPERDISFVGFSISDKQLRIGSFEDSYHVGGVLWDLWWTKWRWGRFSPSTSASPANLHSTNCSTITLIYHLGLVQ